MYIVSMQSISVLLSKRTSRKGFLLTLGVFLFALTGLSRVAQDVRALDKTQTKGGFGGGSYGA